MIAFVQSNSNTGTAATSGSVSITPTSGNALVLIITGTNSAGDAITPTSVSDTKSNVYGVFNSKAASANGGVCAQILTNIIGGALTINFNFTSATSYAAVVLEYSGMDSSGNLGFGVGDASTGTTADSGSFFTFVANSLFLAFVTTDVGNTFTQTSSYTERANIVGFSSLSVVEDIGAAGSKQGTWSLLTIGNWVGLCVGWRPPGFSKRPTMVIGV